VPVIIDIRDLWPDIFEEVLPNWMRTLIKPYIAYSRRRLSKACKNATAIIAITPDFLKWGLKYANRKATPLDKVFYMGYQDSPMQNLKTYDEWKKYGIKDTDFVACFFGYLGRQFNIDPIIDAAELLKDKSNIKFVLCGTGEALPRIKAKVQSLSNVILPGWIEQKRIKSLLELSSVGLAPYRNSINFTMNIPNKFAEYLSAGLPVLLGIDGVMGNLVQQHDCGFVYKNAEELADILLKLENDKLFYKTLSRNSRYLYEEQFMASKIYLDMAQHLFNIANKTRVISNK
jgi:glycosyltransferase involved in cell wall biosynthesis